MTSKQVRTTGLWLLVASLVMMLGIGVEQVAAQNESAMAAATTNATEETIVAYQPGNGATVLPTVEGTGVTGFNLSRGPGLDQNSGGDFNSRNWTVGGDLAAAETDGDFLSWGFNSTTAYDLTALDIRYDRSNTGPQNIVIQISVAGGPMQTIFTDMDIDTGSEENADIDLSAFTNVTNATFFLFGWNASGATGTFDIEDTTNFDGSNGLVINGIAASTVPNDLTQDFNDLDDTAFTTDSLADGGQLTNAGANNDGGPGLDFASFWFDTRGVANGPVTSTQDANDFIGSNSFAGTNAPDVGPDGTPVAENVEQNFEFNDTDGRVDLIFETVDVSGLSNPTLNLAYWINDTGYESNDSFVVTLSDGTNTLTVLNFGETELEANASADDGTANWNTLQAPIIGLDLTQVTLTVSVDSNSSAENIFIDDVAFVAGIVTPPPTPNVVITEIMQNPSAIGDSLGEYFEIYNAGEAALDIDGWVISDNDSDSHTIALNGQAPIPPGGYVALARSATPGFTPYYVYGDDIALANGADEVVLTDASGNEIDRVEYDGGPAFPSPTGASMILCDLTADNNDGGNWAEASSDLGNGDLGTPGAANDSCDDNIVPTVFINELRVNRTGDRDAETDFFEIQGAAGTDLTGLSLIAISGEFEPGQIDAVFDLNGQMIPADGFWFAGDGDVGTPDLVIDNDPFFGSPATYLIVSGFTGVQGDDLDTNNDGTLETTPWAAILDSVSLIDGDSNADVNYSAVVVGPDGNFLPAGIFRCGDAPTGIFDSNILSFFNNDDDTPGSSNTSACQVDPPPSDITLISAIQGTTDAANFIGETRTVQAVVIGDFGDTGELEGFYVQEETNDEDGNPATSEGIFVFCDGVCSPNVELGNIVTVSGTVAEGFGQTQLTNPTITVDDAGNNFSSISPALISFPLSSESALEAFEGMFVQVSSSMRAIEYFNFDRFSELRVWNDGSSAQRPFQFTQVNMPDATGFQNAEAAFRAASIILDDGSSEQNIGKLFPVDASGTPIFQEMAFNPGNPDGGFRGGDIINGIEGVLGFGFSNYRIHISDRSAGTASDGDPISLSVTVDNPRPTVPTVGGSMQVASFNVLNYFTTFGERGADNATELQRQRDKIAQAICALDAEIVGLIEIENNATAAIQSLLNDAGGVNQRCATYDFIDTGVIGTDQIRVAFIYKPAAVTPVGNFAVLNSTVDPRFVDNRNRPALAQTFQENASDGVVTVVVNHFKSKGDSGLDDPGSICDPNPSADPNCDQSNGAGFWNQVRTDAAEALVDWLATDPTGSGDADVLIIGDLNAYALEQPILAIREGADDTVSTGDDYTDLTNASAGQYGFVFDGRWGTLDYALANQSLVPQVTGVAEWHINADEPDAIDYDFSFNPQVWYDGTDPFRASDHDPVLIGLNLTAPLPTTGTITIIKDVIYNADVDTDSDTDFNFFSEELGSFTLDDPLSDDGDAISNTVTFASLAPGSYTISEGLNSSFTQSVLCVGDDAVSYLNSETGATISLDAGEDVTCTFTNERITQQFTYEKVLVDGTAALDGDWQFTLASLISLFEGTVDTDFGVVTTIPGSGGTSTLTLPTGGYLVGELVPAGYDLQHILCGAGGTSAMPPLNDAFTVLLDSDPVTCTFINIEEFVDPEPTITSPGDQVNTEGDVIDLQVVANDNAPLIFTDRIDRTDPATATLPQGLSINPNGQITGTIAAGASAGSPYSVTITVIDSIGQTASVTIVWTVNAPANVPPTVTEIDDLTNNEGDVIDLQVAASDADGDALSYEGIGLPVGLSITADTGRISGTIMEGAAALSPYAVTINVSDGNNPPVAITFSWTVNTVVSSPDIPNIGICTLPAPNPNSTIWRITNDNPVPFTPGTQERVVFDWRAFLGDMLVQSGDNFSQTGEFVLNTPPADRLEVTFKVSDNGTILNTTVLVAGGEGIGCDAAPAPVTAPDETVVEEQSEANMPDDAPDADTTSDVEAAPDETVVEEQPAVDASAPAETEVDEQAAAQDPAAVEAASEVEEEAASENDAANVEQPIAVAPPYTVMPLSVCWVEDQNGATSVWRITNENAIPLQQGSQAKVRFDVTAYDAANNAIQTINNQEQRGTFQLNTPLATRLDATWRVWDNNTTTDVLGTASATANENACN